MHDPLRRPSPPADAEVDRVAAAMDAEVRAEQAAYEAEALRAEQRARSLPQLARELAVRADTVEVRTAGRTIRGPVVAAGGQHLTLDAPGRRVDVVLAALALLRVVDRNRRPSLPPARAPATVRARFTEHEVAGTPLTVLLADGDEVHGVVAAAAEDHLLLDVRGGAAAVPWAAVVAAWPSPSQAGPRQV